MGDNRGANSDILPEDRPSFMSAAAISALLRLAEIHGLCVEELRSSSGLSDQTERSPDRPYPYRVGLSLWKKLLDKAPKAHLGLEFADLALASERDLVRHLLHHSCTLGDGLEHFIAFQRLVDSESPVQKHFAEREGEIQLRFRDLPILIDSKQPSESMVASVFNLCRGLVGTAFRLRSVEFSHTPERALPPYLEFFGVAPRFGSDRTALSFGAELLELPVKGSLPGLERHLRAQAEQSLISQERDLQLMWESRVTGVFSEHGLGLGLEDVARHLGVTGRTLQRRLSAERTTFEEVLAEARQTKLRELLGYRKLSFDEIARRLGFRDRRSLQRAFRRWTGDGSLMRARARRVLDEGG